MLMSPLLFFIVISTPYHFINILYYNRLSDTFKCYLSSILTTFVPKGFYCDRVLVIITYDGIFVFFRFGQMTTDE